VQRLRISGSMRFRRQIGVLVSLSQVVLLGVLLYRNKETLPLVARLVAPSIIGSCLLLYLISLLLQFSIWSDLLGYRRAEQGRALEEYIRTNFMGRLPGGLWKIVGRMTIYRAPRLPARAILVVNVLEILLMLLASAAVIFLSSSLDWRLRLAGLCSLALTLLLLAVLAARMQSVLQSVHSPVHWIAWTGGYIVAWLCGGMITYLVIAPFDVTITFSDALRYWCIAGATGLLLQVIPLNILIRDATLVALLQSFMSLTNAIIAAFAVRLVMLVCDLAIGWTLLGLVEIIRRASIRSELHMQE
jgi:hypothetical protein